MLPRWVRYTEEHSDYSATGPNCKALAFTSAIANVSRVWTFFNGFIFWIHFYISKIWSVCLFVLNDCLIQYFMTRRRQRDATPFEVRNAGADPGFPVGGDTNPPGGCKHTNLPDFSKNCMKLRKFWSVGGHAPGATPLDRPYKIWSSIKKLTWQKYE